MTTEPHRPDELLAPPAIQLRKATLAVYAVFIVNGFAFASWASRIPQFRDELGVSPAQLGLILLSAALGSLVALPLSGLMVTRLGESRAIVVMSMLLAAGLVVALPALDTLHGPSIDILTALRWRIYGNAHAPESSTAVLVALDEETFRTPPFEGTPSVTWTPAIGQVLTEIIDGGAAVVGFDVVFSTSIEQSAVPFGGETLGERVRGFDRDYLRALVATSSANTVGFEISNVRPSDSYFDGGHGGPGQVSATKQQDCSERTGFAAWNEHCCQCHAEPSGLLRLLPRRLLPFAGLRWWAQSTPATEGDLHDQDKIEHRREAVRSNGGFKTS